MTLWWRDESHYNVQIRCKCSQPLCFLVSYPSPWPPKTPSINTTLCNQAPSQTRCYLEKCWTRPAIERYKSSHTRLDSSCHCTVWPENVTKSSILRNYVSYPVEVRETAWDFWTSNRSPLDQPRLQNISCFQEQWPPLAAFQNGRQLTNKQMIGTRKWLEWI